MKGSWHILIYMVLCTIFLGSPLITGFSLHKLKVRETEDVLENTDHFDGLDENNNQSFQANVEEYQLTTPSTVTKASQGISDGASINNTFGVNEQQDNYSLYDNSSGKGGSPEMNSSSFAVMLNPSGQAETLYENGILTTALSTVDYISKETSQSIDTGLDKNYGAEEEDNKKTDQQESSFQLNTMEMLTTSPRTSNNKATDSQASVSLHVNEPMAVSQISSDLKNENGSSTETNSVTDVTLEIAYSNLETVTQVSPENRTAEITVPQQNSEWDDTKFSNVVPLPVTADIKSMKDQNVTTRSEAIVASSPTFPGIDAQSENNTNATQNGSGFVSEENLQTDYSEPNTSETEITSTQPAKAMTEEHNSSTSLLDSTVATRQIGDAKEQDTELPSGTTAPAFVIHSAISATEEFIIEDNEGEETFPQESALNSATPRLEDLKKKPKDDASLAISLSTILPVVIPGEAENLTPSITTQISQEQVPFPMRIEVPKSYRPDKLESEEGDEQDEEDDDEDDDGEQEEEDKDTDSVDESVEGDVALPPFTLPGLSFQDPGEDEIGRGAYHVPDALEWERQKQGLMRSWMEKLKDKAGYMSGMLVPVGVGVAGAILILGALYIIKIMNRRRRNGFKQHKRKQREFNSMQDRVMLLADSSEDEF